MSLKNYHLRQQEICRSLAALAQQDGSNRARYLTLAERHHRRAAIIATSAEPGFPPLIVGGELPTERSGRLPTSPAR